MALPAGFLDDLKNRLSLAQVVGRKVTWDQRKSNQGKGDFWSPCPFHQEKTASFHVDDRKGFYYCFGCHAKGDALNFVRETENVDFMEAVEILAREAGMTVPAQDPRAKEDAKVRSTLHDVMELAINFYRLNLNAAHADAARNYIQSRGLDNDQIQTFEIGFAPSKRTALIEHLKSKNVDAKQMIDAGLIIPPDDGGPPFDRFRDRIMFPIRDGRGKPIAFGGRAMSPDAKAKYLNSPETPLFDKGRSLYNHAPARQAAGKTQSLIVAEGYMDVVALSSFGFDHSVAPLGTAITSDQLQLMWRIADEPIIALDGDKAGVRAATRLIDVALPLLEAGKSLRFALMPEGLDPDDLLRSGGATAMQKQLDDAIPMAELLWRREIEGKVFDSPERRAALDASLKKSLGLIADASIREHYRHDFRHRRSELFAPQRQSQGFAPQGQFNKFTKGKAGPARPSAGAKSSYLARAENLTNAEARVREVSILESLLAHPKALSVLESDIETLPITHPELGRIKEAILNAAPKVMAAFESNPDTEDAILRHDVQSQLGVDALGVLSGKSNARLAVHSRATTTLEMVVQSITSDIARHKAILGRINEIRDAEDDILRIDDEGLTWRLQEAERSLDHASRLDDVESSGLHTHREENLRNLDTILEQTAHTRKKP